MARSVRDHRYHYVRNYMPHIGYNQQTAWPDQGEIRHEFYELAKGEMTAPQRHFAGPTRPLEELYDSQTDPLSLNNLIDSPDHQDIAQRMRGALKEHTLNTRDLGFIPEIEIEKQSTGSTPYDWAQSASYDLPAHMAAAQAVGTNDYSQFRLALSSTLPGVRYWGVMGYTAAEELPAEELAILKNALSDESEVVQLEAATALLKHGHTNESLQTLMSLLNHDNETVVLYAARALELGGEKSRPAYASMKALNEKYAASQPTLVFSSGSQPKDSWTVWIHSERKLGFVILNAVRDPYNEKESLHSRGVSPQHQNNYLPLLRI